MKTSNKSVVVGVFHNVPQAQQAVRDLKAAGFSDDQIGIISRDESAHHEAHTSKGSGAARGAATGVAAGAGVGALWALGIAAGILPVIGPVVAGGLLGSVLASAAGGAAIAGLVGALVGLGIPEEDAAYYEGEFKSGRTLVTVKADKRYAEAWKILHSHDAYNRELGAESTLAHRTHPLNTSAEGLESQTESAEERMGGSAKGRRTASIRTDSVVSDDDQTVEVHEEQLHARKTAVKTGEARVRKEVITEEQTLHVPVTREELVIERKKVSGRASSADIGETEEVIRIPLTEEQVHLEKETVVVEEVSVGKRKVTDTESVSGKVRKEEVKVVTDGEVNVTDDKKKKK